VFFTVCVALLVIFLNFLRWNLPKFLQHIASSGIRILNAEKVGFVKADFLIFSNLCHLPLQKISSHRFPWKKSSDWSKIFTTNLPNFTEFHRRIFTVSFAFSAHVDVRKYPKVLTFSFERAQITWVFVLSTRAIVKLYGATLRWLNTVLMDYNSPTSNSSNCSKMYFLSLFTVYLSLLSFYGKKLEQLKNLNN